MSEYSPVKLSVEGTTTGRLSSKEPSISTPPRGDSVEIERKFTKANQDPFDLVAWEFRTAEITNPTTGEKVFHAENLEFPASWSDNCTALVAEKYFRHVEYEYTNGVTETRKRKETSVREMVRRVADTITRWGTSLHVFREGPDAAAFNAELKHILVNQMAAFNSPVWFNVGTKRGVMREEQCSACFINSVDDSMDSILELGRTEGVLYKGGSGSGVNYSNLRSSKEKLSIGGTSSGPVPFIAKDDLNAGAIKSGGGTRRAAKMAILNADHPDIFEFVGCKAHSEKAAHALIDAGFDGDFRARWGAYQMLPFQNANHSIRVTDEFMEAVKDDLAWELLGRDGSIIEIVSARSLFDAVCDAAYHCGDPGMQFDTTINGWHTCPDSGRINGSNPCSEYMFLDDTACNLASINLIKFLDEGGNFDIDGFRHTVDVLITAMEILVDGASYPTQKIQDNSEKYRPLGLGYTNLGAFFMRQGLAYDSDEAREQCSFLTSLLTARAYRQSAKLAQHLGPFLGYAKNSYFMQDVIKRHAAESVSVRSTPSSGLLAWSAATEDWADAAALGSQFGFRNSQVTVLAPTGTISFLMDCDTTSIEPELALVKYKKLVGGGGIKIVNRRVIEALGVLGYSEAAIDVIEAYVLDTGSVVGSGVDEAHYPVFDSAFPESVEGRFLRPEAHILMMAAAQPFLSGAISKTCNIPKSATKQDVASLYVLAWRSGLKSVALYRDGSKRTQPLASVEEKAEAAPAPSPVRRKLPRECPSLRHKFDIGAHEGYIHVGVYEDGTPGEIFIKMAKEGSTVSGLMDAWGIQTSMSLQYGVPIEQIVDKFKYTSFEPSGWSSEPGIGHARSILDYVARWLEMRYVNSVVDNPVDTSTPAIENVVESDATGIACPSCGHTTQRTGACATCPVCGWTQGCG